MAVARWVSSELEPRLLHEGWARKASRHLGRWRLRWLVLAYEHGTGLPVLSTYQRERSRWAEIRELSRGGIAEPSPTERLVLVGATCYRCAADGSMSAGRPHAFAVNLRGRDFLFATESEAEAAKWMRALSMSLAELALRLGGLSPSIACGQPTTPYEPFCPTPAGAAGEAQDTPRPCMVEWSESSSPALNRMASDGASSIFSPSSSAGMQTPPSILSGAEAGADEAEGLGMPEPDPASSLDGEVACHAPPETPHRATCMHAGKSRSARSPSTRLASPSTPSLPKSTEPLDRRPQGSDLRPRISEAARAVTTAMSRCTHNASLSTQMVCSCPPAIRGMGCSDSFEQQANVHRSPPSIREAKCGLSFERPLERPPGVAHTASLDALDIDASRPRLQSGALKSGCSRESGEMRRELQPAAGRSPEEIEAENASLRMYIEQLHGSLDAVALQQVEKGIEELLARQSELRGLLDAAREAREAAWSATQRRNRACEDGKTNLDTASTPTSPRQADRTPASPVDFSKHDAPPATPSEAVDADAAANPYPCDDGVMLCGFASPLAADKAPPSSPPETPEVRSAVVAIQSRLRGALAREVAATEAEVADLERGLAGVELQLHFLRDQANQISARMTAASKDASHAGGYLDAGDPNALHDDVPPIAEHLPVYEPFCGSRLSVAEQVRVSDPSSSANVGGRNGLDLVS